MSEHPIPETAPIGPNTDGQRRDAIDISVCICTFRRPASLLRLLRSLRGLDPATPPHEIIVVDNDAHGTAEPAVRQARTEGLDVQYSVEPVRGIARARNRAVAPARGEYIAFVDDDEEADPQWLDRLWAEVTRSGADAGVGPVIPRFSDGTPRWLIEGGFFERPRFPTGTSLRPELMRTGNALVRRQVLAALQGPFDHEYDLTGGEDTDVFVRMACGGARFIAVDSAIVHEHLPPARTNARWLLKRRFRIGLGAARIQHTGQQVRMRHWRGLPYLTLAFALGLSGMLVFPFSRIFAMYRLQRAARHLGRSAYFFGFSYRPYLSDTRQ